MDDRNLDKLQIYAVEEADHQSATCIVRCVGGIVRPGQRFDVGSPSADHSNERSQIVLDWIDRYGNRVDFVDPPHNAKVHFSGSGVSLLEKGVTITSVGEAETALRRG
ncbi:hypothetical protein ACWD5R_09615 [Streptomyces sp. NPDC002514]|uniref:hypothetical protein n=1 Tax=Streptomyces sp. NPDC001270 TaxID=3364554 RepID=UPI00368A96C0